MRDDLTPAEAAWIDYARSVVLGDHHTDMCRRAGGGCLEINGTPELPWPGYIGPQYRSGGLLLVGNVHRNFASDWCTALGPVAPH